ncbi:DUF4931 domain-containing protein [Aneurinibacillus sp. Ricciae_BoGa-3]|uniref:DUF4931 domain-containing protein n=1 Tax=Aneurinibacillus sp. Ricciae_BoGa-3 TaxID=3022697 RepID=UPI0023425E97|nr:DUF4931 domain-containing protein [Aneurinibacillus sp. Ricciae_BoGa-3]WCK52404.1 DUF4931 domain-containing protein [Aneurinibacillus sp. Ricciae_BoGa-3]
MNTYMRFRTSIAREKPTTHGNTDTACPFCDRETIRREGVVISEQGPFMLIENKFQTLEKAYQMVLVETFTCEEGDISTYSSDYLHDLMRFAVTQWLAMEQSGKYRSVAFFKNHGIHAGGSIYHPHMQIVGLVDVDYRAHVQAEHFIGLVIDSMPGVELNLSSCPLSGFTEFNVLLDDFAQLNIMADYIQKSAHFILTHMNRRFSSYNLFLYFMEGKIRAKMILRAPASPYFMGYSIVQIPNNQQEVVDRFQSLYFN